MKILALFEVDDQRLKDNDTNVENEIQSACGYGMSILDYKEVKDNIDFFKIVEENK